MAGRHVTALQNTGVFRIRHCICCSFSRGLPRPPPSPPAPLPRVGEGGALFRGGEVNGARYAGASQSRSTFKRFTLPSHSSRTKARASPASRSKIPLRPANGPAWKLPDAVSVKLCRRERFWLCKRAKSPSTCARDNALLLRDRQFLDPDGAFRDCHHGALGQAGGDSRPDIHQQIGKLRAWLIIPASVAVASPISPT